MKHSLGLGPLLIGLTFIPAAYAADSNALEEDVTVLKEDTAEINSRLDDMLSISGYTDVEYVVTDKDGSYPGFRLHHLSLFFEKRITDQWRFFSEIEYEDTPKFEADENTVSGDVDGDSQEETLHKFAAAQGKLFVEAVNLSFLWRPDASLRVGRFFTPAGIWNVDHYPPFVPTQERPLHIRGIFPQVFDGAMAYGTRPLGGSFLKYELYWGNGEGNTGKKDSNSHKAVGLNTGLLLPFLKHTEIGLTYYTDTLNNRTEKTATGAHLKIKAGGFAFQSEYAVADYKPTTGSKYDSTGYYAQFMYDIGNWTAGVRNSLYDPKSTETNELVANSVFLNYHVSPSVVLKMEYHQFDYDDASKDDYTSTLFSAVAYLGN